MPLGGVSCSTPLGTGTSGPFGFLTTTSLPPSSPSPFSCPSFSAEAPAAATAALVARGAGSSPAAVGSRGGGEGGCRFSLVKAVVMITSSSWSRSGLLVRAADGVSRWLGDCDLFFEGEVLEAPGFRSMSLVVGCCGTRGFCLSASKVRANNRPFKRGKVGALLHTRYNNVGTADVERSPERWPDIGRPGTGGSSTVIKYQA